MIEVVQMPTEQGKFATVLNSIDLRCQGYLDHQTWIGHAIDRCGTLEEIDRRECFHIINHDGEHPVGYARLVPVGSQHNDSCTSDQIAHLARQSDRYPAYELQTVCFETSGDAPEEEADSNTILRQLVIEALRIANNRQVKFIYTTSDRAGTARLKRIGLRYSTLSAPFDANGRTMVILCFAVTNSNIISLSPLQVVGGTATSPDVSNQIRAGAERSEFSRLETISKLMESSDPPPGPTPA